VSVLAHAGFFLTLVSHLGSAPSYPPAPVMNVVLARLPAPRPPPRDRPSRRRGLGAQAPTPQQEIALRPTPSPGEVASSALPGRAAGDLQAALRGLVGCTPSALTPLSREQRETCEERLAKRQVADLGRQAGRLNLDLSGAFGKDPQAILERRSHNGCRARAGGDVAPLGEIGVAAGVACAKPF
jgi:hypothetical protein